jgi:hypothetical protein
LKTEELRVFCSPLFRIANWRGDPLSGRKLYLVWNEEVGGNGKEKGLDRL